MFSGGNRGHCPPPFWHDYFQPTRKGGGGFEPPQSFGPATETYRQVPENAEIHRKTPNAAKCHKTLQMRIAKLPRHKKDDGGGGVNDGDSG